MKLLRTPKKRKPKEKEKSETAPRADRNVAQHSNRKRRIDHPPPLTPLIVAQHTTKTNHSTPVAVILVHKYLTIHRYLGTYHTSAPATKPPIRFKHWRSSHFLSDSRSFSPPLVRYGPCDRPR